MIRTEAKLGPAESFDFDGKEGNPHSDNAILVRSNCSKSISLEMEPHVALVASCVAERNFHSVSCKLHLLK